MERRYLAVTVAMAATFALFSHAFGSGLLNKVHDPRATLTSEIHCAAQSLRAHLLEKVNHSLGANAEEAQLRVELNLPAPPPAAVPALPGAPAVTPVAPVAPVKVAAPPVAACPSQRLVSDARLAQDFDTKMQAKMMALQSKLMAQQAKLQAKLAAQQARVNSQVQREISRAAMVQVRATLAQAKIKSHPCPGQKTVLVSAGDDDMDINVDVDQLSNQIEQQVSRSLRNTVRNF